MSKRFDTANDAEFDLVIGDLERDIPELAGAAYTWAGTRPGCDACTCVRVYCA
jgi:hypothetical protein